MKKIRRHLVLVRHGESQWNAKGLWTGWHDVPLTQKGRIQAQKAAQALREIPFHVAFTSDLKRAQETLEIIKQELGLPHLPTIQEPGFKERHYGDYTGKDKWLVKKEVGDEKFKRIRRGWNEPIPGGESLKDVYTRVVPHITNHLYPRITKGENILLAIHGNSIRAIVKHLEGISDENISEIEFATGEIIVYQLDKKGKVLKKERRGKNEDKGKQ